MKKEFFSGKTIDESIPKPVEPGSGERGMDAGWEFINEAKEKRKELIAGGKESDAYEIRKLDKLIKETREAQYLSLDEPREKPWKK